MSNVDQDWIVGKDISKHYRPFIYAPVTDSHFSPTQRPAAPNLTHAEQSWSISPRLIHLAIYRTVCPKSHAKSAAPLLYQETLRAIYQCTSHILPFLAHTTSGRAKFNPRLIHPAIYAAVYPKAHMKSLAPLS